MSDMENVQDVMRRARALQLEINEMSNPANAGVYYLSFATEGEFLGGVFIEAHGIMTAVRKTNELGINPGGEVACWGPVPPPVASAMNRLLSKEEVETTPPADIRIEDIANERELHEHEEECGATNPHVDHGSPCIRFQGHAEYDGQRNHITQAGSWWA